MGARPCVDHDLDVLALKQHLALADERQVAIGLAELFQDVAA
jgi:hypothetical protein